MFRKALLKNLIKKQMATIGVEVIQKFGELKRHTSVVTHSPNRSVGVAKNRVFRKSGVSFRSLNDLVLAKCSLHKMTSQELLKMLSKRTRCVSKPGTSGRMEASAIDRTASI